MRNSHPVVSSSAHQSQIPTETTQLTQVVVAEAPTTRTFLPLPSSCLANKLLYHSLAPISRPFPLWQKAGCEYLHLNFAETLFQRPFRCDVQQKFEFSSCGNRASGGWWRWRRWEELKRGFGLKRGTAASRFQYLLGCLGYRRCISVWVNLNDKGRKGKLDLLDIVIGAAFGAKWFWCGLYDTKLGCSDCRNGWQNDDTLSRTNFRSSVPRSLHSSSRLFPPSQSLTHMRCQEQKAQPGLEVLSSASGPSPLPRISR